MNQGTANFLSGGLASNTFWTGAFAFDSVKKCVPLPRVCSACLVALTSARAVGT